MNPQVANKLINIVSDHQTYGIPQVDYLIDRDSLGAQFKQKQLVIQYYSKFCFWQEYCFDEQLKQIEDCLILMDNKKFQQVRLGLTTVDPLNIKTKKVHEKKQVTEKKYLIKDQVKSLAK